jgi:hypothetical protein
VQFGQTAKPIHPVSFARLLALNPGSANLIAEIEQQLTKT